MIRVRDLLKGSTFIHEAEFSLLNPQISIILPTFRRGDNGLFKKAIDSLLVQTFKNFELIIIDDASTDSTFEQIKRYIKIDKRVSAIRHQRNIGLPGLSCNEAFLKTRSRKIFFAFDDNFYKKNALEEIWNYQEKNKGELVTYAISKTFLKDKTTVQVGNEDFDFNKMLIYNFIPNSPMIVDREVLDDVGLYDPHICITRLCDWDLWIRVGSKYSFSRIPKILSYENGPNQSDSIGNSHLLDMSLIREWMCQDRNLSLRPENFLDYNVSSTPDHISDYSRYKIEELLSRKFPQLIVDKVPEKKFDNGYMILLTESFDVSVGFYFLSLEKLKKRVIILHYDSIEIFKHSDLILGASFVVFSRTLSEKSYSISNLLKTLKIPYYYFTDDNFFEINPGTLNKNSQLFLENSNGVLLSTQDLIKYFRKNKLHKNLINLSPSLNEVLLKKHKKDLSHFINSKEINFVFAGNSRFDGLKALIPTLKQLTSKFTIRLYSFNSREGLDNKELAYLCQKNQIEFILLDFNPIYEVFLGKLKNKKIHFFLHPEGKSEAIQKNYKYKSLSFLMTPMLTSSLILLPDIYPYNTLKNCGNISEIIYKKPNEVLDLIEKLLSNPQQVEKVFLDLEDFCKKAFDPSSNDSVINDLFKKHSSTSILDFCYRINSINLIQKNNLNESINFIQKNNLKNLAITFKKTIYYYIKKINFQVRGKF